MSDTHYTIDEINALKESLALELQDKEKKIDTMSRMLFAPPSSESKVQHWVNQAERAMAIYDGAVLGFKLLSNFRRIFNSGKRKKRS